MEAEKKEKKVGSPKKKTKKKDSPSQLYERCWSVVNFEMCVASGLTYDEAVLEMKNQARKKASGLCIVTDEAAKRINQKH